MPTTYYAFVDDPHDLSSATGAIMRFEETPISVTWQRWDGDGWVTDPHLIEYTHGDETRDVMEVTEPAAMIIAGMA